MVYPDAQEEKLRKCAQTKEDTSQNTLVSTKSKDESQEPMAEIRLVSAKDREEMSLSTRQAREPELAVVMKYLQSGVLTRMQEN